MPVSQRARGNGRKAVSAGELAFGEFLQRSLHDMYDAVAGEPIPEELLRLIARDREK